MTEVETVLQQSGRARMSVWPVIAILVCGAAYLCAVAFETTVFPIRTNQSIENVTRTADRLCWEWVSYKTRNRVSDGLNVTVTAGDNVFPWTVFERDTGLPWTKSRAVGVGWHRQPYCISLPPLTDKNDVIRVAWVARYPGLLGPLYDVYVRFPEIVSVPVRAAGVEVMP